MARWIEMRVSFDGLQNKAREYRRIMELIEMLGMTFEEAECSRKKNWGKAARCIS